MTQNDLLRKYPKHFPNIIDTLNPREQKLANLNLHIQKTYGLAGIRLAHELNLEELVDLPDFDENAFLQKIEERLPSDAK